MGSYMPNMMPQGAYGNPMPYPQMPYQLPVQQVSPGIASQNYGMVLNAPRGGDLTRESPWQRSRATIATQVPESGYNGTYTSADTLSAIFKCIYSGLLPAQFPELQDQLSGYATVRLGLYADSSNTVPIVSMDEDDYYLYGRNTNPNSTLLDRQKKWLLSLCWSNQEVSVVPIQNGVSYFVEDSSYVADYFIALSYEWKQYSQAGNNLDIAKATITGTWYKRTGDDVIYRITGHKSHAFGVTNTKWRLGGSGFPCTDTNTFGQVSFTVPNPPAFVQEYKNRVAPPENQMYVTHIWDGGAKVWKYLGSFLAPEDILTLVDSPWTSDPKQADNMFIESMRQLNRHSSSSASYTPKTSSAPSTPQIGLPVAGTPLTQYQASVVPKQQSPQMYGSIAPSPSLQHHAGLQQSPQYHTPPLIQQANIPYHYSPTHAQNQSSVNSSSVPTIEVTQATPENSQTMDLSFMSRKDLKDMNNEGYLLSLRDRELGLDSIEKSHEFPKISEEEDSDSDSDEDEDDEYQPEGGIDTSDLSRQVNQKLTFNQENLDGEEEEDETEDDEMDYFNRYDEELAKESDSEEEEEEEESPMSLGWKKQSLESMRSNHTNPGPEKRNKLRAPARSNKVPPSPKYPVRLETISDPDSTSGPKNTKKNRHSKIEEESEGDSDDDYYKGYDNIETALQGDDGTVPVNFNSNNMAAIAAVLAGPSSFELAKHIAPIPSQNVGNEHTDSPARLANMSHVISDPSVPVGSIEMPKESGRAAREETEVIHGSQDSNDSSSRRLDHELNVPRSFNQDEVDSVLNQFTNPNPNFGSADIPGTLRGFSNTNDMYDSNASAFGHSNSGPALPAIHEDQHAEEEEELKNMRAKAAAAAEARILSNNHRNASKPIKSVVPDSPAFSNDKLTQPTAASQPTHSENSPVSFKSTPTQIVNQGENHYPQNDVQTKETHTAENLPGSLPGNLAYHPALSFSTPTDSSTPIKAAFDGDSKPQVSQQLTHANGTETPTKPGRETSEIAPLKPVNDVSQSSTKEPLRPSAATPVPSQSQAAAPAEAINNSSSEQQQQQQQQQQNASSISTPHPAVHSHVKTTLTSLYSLAKSQGISLDDFISLAYEAANETDKN